MSTKQRIIVLIFIIGAVYGLMGDIVAGYVAPAFEGRHWVVYGIFAVSLIVGLWLALRQEEVEQPHPVQLPPTGTPPEQCPRTQSITQSPIIPSPFTVGHPVEPDSFFGREEQVERFFAVIGSRQIQSLSILGLRRSGKTSFLCYASHPSTMTNCLPHSNNYVLAFVDLQSAIITTPANFYRTVIKALTAAADISSPLNRFDQPLDSRHLGYRLALVISFEIVQIRFQETEGGRT